MSKIHRIVATAVAALVVQGASAAIEFEKDSLNDAGSVAGSFDKFIGESESDSFSGISNAVVLEALDPGVGWTSFKLVLSTYDDTERNITVTFAGLAGSLSAHDDDTTTAGLRNKGWTYTYTFSGQLPAGEALTLTVSDGFTGRQAGHAVLTAYASGIASVIPEPGAPAMLLAGLGALVFVSRRRQP